MAQSLNEQLNQLVYHSAVLEEFTSKQKPGDKSKLDRAPDGYPEMLKSIADYVDCACFIVRFGADAEREQLQRLAPVVYRAITACLPDDYDRDEDVVEVGMVIKPPDQMTLYPSAHIPPEFAAIEDEIIADISRKLGVKVNPGADET